MIGHIIMIATLAAASSFRPFPDIGRKQVQMVSTQDERFHEQRAEERSGLPYAFGRNFHSLDAYLLHLQQYAGPIGLPWWRPVGPDRFQHVRGMRPFASAPEFATRAELVRRFGFLR